MKRRISIITALLSLCLSSIALGTVNGKEQFDSIDLRDADTIVQDLMYKDALRTVKSVFSST